MYTQINKNVFPIFLILLVAVCYLWDIGNPDAMRQGTEGFYLQISKEMFSQNSILTPLYNGVAHWSKPPLHFWLPFPIYYIFGSATLFGARLTMAIVGLLGSFAISRWMYRHFQSDRLTTFLYLSASFGFLKYSRIFMMEITLSIFSVLAALFYYDYLKKRELISLLLASTLLGCSILIKGPVSLIMIFGGISLFYMINFYLHKKIPELKPFILFISIGTLVGSVWFLLCLNRYGANFFNYFFVRENLGKFSSQSYPISNVIGGLFFYSLPWGLFIPILFLKKIKLRLLLEQNLYLIATFLVFFLIWFIPKQRSHHYAIPSLPLFLLILKVMVLDLAKVDLTHMQEKIFSFIKWTIAALFILLTFLLLSLHSYASILTGASALFVSYTMIKNSELKIKALSFLLFLGSIWSIFIPSYFLPALPKNIVEKIGTQKVSAIVRKPYFMMEVLGRQMDIVDRENAKSFITTHPQLHIIHEEDYQNKTLSENASIKAQWKIWKRGNTFNAICHAVLYNDMSALQENLLLVESPKAP